MLTLSPSSNRLVARRKNQLTPSITNCAPWRRSFARLAQYNQLTVMKFGDNALTEFLNVLIEWETAIVEELRTN